MARRKQEIERDSKALITQITEFEEDDENFQLCEQFVSSNFKYHKFLSVNSHEVTRNINGIHDKFRIHSQKEKAESFYSLVEQFLDAPIFENRDHGRTDTHYALLSLLLKLADSPTSTDYTKSHEAEVIAREEFDWAAYLLEGEELYRGPFPESPDFSDEDDYADDLHVRFKDESKDDKNLSRNITTTSISEVEVSFDEQSSVHTSEVWLRQNLVVQYWNGEVSTSADQSCGHLSVDWEFYQSQVNPLYIEVNRAVITEQQLIREVLWMLSGVDGSFVYEVNNNNQFEVKAALDARHLTEDAVKSYLSTLAAYGNIVLQLQTFIDEVVNTDQTQRPVCQTYEAFVSTLVSFLSSYRQDLLNLENTVKKEEETVTLMSVHTQLKMRFKQLNLLHRVLTQGVYACKDVDSNSQRASHLLTTIYDMLLSSDTLGDYGNESVSLLFPIWVQVFKPYLDIIDEWITNGSLIDPKAEFIVQRNPDVKSLDETFWDTAFTLHCSEMEKNSTSGKDNSSSQIKTERDQTSCDSLHVTLSDASFTYANQLVPDFLKPLLEKIILVGKSMEVLQNLGRLSEVLENNGNIFYKKPSLYEIFLEELSKYFGVNPKHTAENGKSKTDLQTLDSSSTVFSDNIKEQMRVKGVHDPLLLIHFSSVFDPRKIRYESLTAEQEDLQRELERLDMNGLSPIQLAIHRCLMPHVLAKYDRICSKVITILKEEYKLIYYIGIMRQFFLMEAGDTMYDIYTEIFDKLCLHEPWQDLSFLNFVLHDALRSRFTDELNRMHVSIEKSENNQRRNKLPINALDGLTLHYKVPWPVDIVLNSRCLDVYNQVFTFLLQVKRAKYCLDKLRFCDLERENIAPVESFKSLPSAEVIPRSHVFHRMQIFRMRLMHFVNSLHSYLMTTILHSSGLKFQDEVDKASDLEEVIRIHGEYIQTLHNRCLLHKSKAVLKEAVMKVLNLALTFYDHWTEGVNSVQVVMEMEAEYARCSQFLSSFLNTIIKRGYFPHLESLAIALATSTDCNRPTR